MHRAALRARPFRILALAVVVALVVVASTTLLSGTAKAAITSPFTPRFSANANGSILLRGNTSLLCPATATGCTDGQNGVAGSATESLNNNGYVMQYANDDSDPTTFDVSTSTIAMPAGSTVLFAGLYWSADPTAGAGGSAAPTAADDGKVLFGTPGGSGWNSVTASTLYNSGTINAYQGFAHLVSDGHGGTALATVRIRVTETAASTGSSGGGKLAKTGDNIVSVVTTGTLAVLVGGLLYVVSQRGGTLIPAAWRGHGPGRHRPGRHR